MKVWTKFLELIGRPRRAEANPLELFVNAMDALKNAQREHIADLRTLVDQAHDRERELAGMVKLVMEDRFYRPVVTPRVPVQAPEPAIDINALVDVTHFDEDEDAELVKQQSEKQQQLEREFKQILEEEVEYRGTRA